MIMSEPRGTKRKQSPEELIEELKLLKTTFRRLEKQMKSNASTAGNNNKDQASDTRAPDRSSWDEGYTSSDAANPPNSPLESQCQRNGLHAPPPPKHAKHSKVIESNNSPPSRPKSSKDNISRNKNINLTNKPPSSPPANNILPKLADGLNFVLRNGLPKEERFRLHEKYKIPSNCTLIKAPFLNPEVIPFMDEKAKKRDSIMFKNQDKLGTCMAAIAEGVTLASRSGDGEVKTALEHINRGLHLLADYHYNQTRLRRVLCTTVDSQLKSFLVANLSQRHHNFQEINHLFKRDDTIFGRDTGNMIKELLPQ